MQGLYKEEGKERFGEQYKMWQKDAANFEIDGHYPVRELWARARSCWDLILKDKSRSALVVAHNAVNQALVATATGEAGTENLLVLLWESSIFALVVLLSCFKSTYLDSPGQFQGRHSSPAYLVLMWLQSSEDTSGVSPLCNKSVSLSMRLMCTSQ